METHGRILVVEDDPQWSERLQEYLQNEGFEVVAIKTKEEALKILERENFHFATIDLKLSEKDDKKNFEGWEVMKKVFKVGLDRMMSIMIVTGFPRDEEINNQITAIFAKNNPPYFMEKGNFDKKKFIEDITGAVKYRSVHFAGDRKS